MNNNITVYKKASGTQFHFLNSSITLPDSPGLYAFDVACGSGKSTALKLFVALNWEDGVCIAVPTKKDANDMETALIQEGVPNTEIVTLHSDRPQVIKEFKSNPDSLKDKKVVIITHPRIFMNPIELFCKDKKYVIIDELPLFIRYQTIVSKQVLTMFSNIDRNPNDNGCQILEMPGYYAHPYDTKTMEDIYELYIRKTKFSFLSGNDILNQRMRESAFKYINLYMSQQFNSLSDIKIRSDILALKNTHQVLLFDGTFDLLDRGIGKEFTVLKDTATKKYSSPIHFQEFKMPFKRKQLMETINKTKLEQLIQPLISEMLIQINMLPPTEKILFFCWMDVKAEGKLELDNDADDYLTDSKLYKNHKVDLVKLLNDGLVKRGISPSRYAIHYRGSGYDKGRNDFRNYAAISFLGDWNVDHSIAKTVNQVYGTDCSYTDYKMAQIVQAILRIRIRQHKGEPITVFYSDDIDRDGSGELKEVRVMYRVFNYFCKASSGRITGFDKPNIHRDLLKLNEKYPDIFISITQNKPLVLPELTLKELSQILDREPKTRAYTKLIVHLRDKYGITLKIKSG